MVWYLVKYRDKFAFSNDTGTCSLEVSRFVVRHVTSSEMLCQTITAGSSEQFNLPVYTFIQLNGVTET
jgi:hypothetical protein